MSRTNSGNEDVIFNFSFVNGHFTGKRRWDRLELVAILLWLFSIGAYFVRD